MASDPITEYQRLRWYQFSLRTLMLVVTAVCILTALSATIWRRIRRSAAVQQAISSGDPICRQA